MKREISTAQRKVQAATALWAGCVALCRIISDGSADSLPLPIVYPLSSILAFDGRAAGLSRLPMPYRTWDFDRVFHLVSACFTWIHLSGKKIANWEAENLRFQLRGTDAQQVFADCQCPSCHPVSLTERSAAIFSLSVSPCFTLRHAKTR